MRPSYITGRATERVEIHFPDAWTRRVRLAQQPQSAEDHDGQRKGQAASDVERPAREAAGVDVAFRQASVAVFPAAVRLIRGRLIHGAANRPSARRRRYRPNVTQNWANMPTATIMQET